MLLKVTLYSQRDSRWAREKIGKSSSTIFDYGCLITSFGMYIGKTPKEVNAILTQGGGYAGDLFVWSKCTLLGLNQVYKSPSYANTPVPDKEISQIKTFLNNGQPLICHIDFNPSTATDEMHWVLLCGYEGDKVYAADPWTGQVINLDVYGGAKRAIIEYYAYDKKLEKEVATVSVPSRTFEELVRKATERDEYYALGYGTPVELDKLMKSFKEKLKLQEELTRQFEQQYKVSENEKKGLEEALQGLKRAFEKLEGENAQLKADLVGCNEFSGYFYKETDILLDRPFGLGVRLVRYV